MTRFLVVSAGLVLLTATLAVGQVTEPPDSIILLRSRGNAYAPGVTSKQLLSWCKQYPEAYQEMKKARSQQILGRILAFAGLVGFMSSPILSWNVDAKPNWGLAVLGAGLMVVSIPIHTSASTHLTNAAEIYNREKGAHINGKFLTMQQLAALSKAYPDAYKEMKAVKSSKILGYVFGFSGIILIGAELGSSNPSLPLTALGGVLALVSIPIYSSYRQHLVNAMNICYSNKQQLSYHKVDIRMGFTGNGLGVKMTF